METVELTRDCEVTVIPGGDHVTLSAGTPVDITHSLGGTYTVRAGAGLYRVNSSDADALGKEIKETVAVSGGEVTAERVHEALKNVYDPEIPVNIVDLGLVYDTSVLPDEGEVKVRVQMTLTAQGCGMGPSIAADAQNKILALGGVSQADVEIVWDPPWHQSMISEAGRQALGLE
tara:strand:+ start:567 stop:1091 length:525 start_codon:yes stop_codon:yes gene_type:complete